MPNRNVSGQADVTIRTEPERLWTMVTNVTRMGEWSPETERAEWLDGASRPAVGARFRGYNRRGRSKWSTTCEVIEAEPGRVFAFAVGKANKPETVWRYRFEAVDGGVRVTESFQLRKPLGFLSRLVTRVTTGVKDRPADLEDGVRTTLAALKRAAEIPADPLRPRP
ncbi:MAG: SRPBCC family protein [Acidimicrobiales bacterium]